MRERGRQPSGGALGGEGVEASSEAGKGLFRGLSLGCCKVIGGGGVVKKAGDFALWEGADGIGGHVEASNEECKGKIEVWVFDRRKIDKVVEQSSSGDAGSDVGGRGMLEGRANAEAP